MRPFKCHGNTQYLPNIHQVKGKGKETNHIPAFGLPQSNKHSSCLLHSRLVPLSLIPEPEKQVSKKCLIKWMDGWMDEQTDSRTVGLAGRSGRRRGTGIRLPLVTVQYFTIIQFSVCDSALTKQSQIFKLGLSY